MLQITKKTLLPLVAQYLPTAPIILEAGAFNGHDTQLLKKFWPQATIYAFEPVPGIFAQLKSATQNLPDVHCYQAALAATTDTATFYVSEHPDRPQQPFQAGSLLAPKERLQHSPATYPYTIKVPTTNLDEWANKHKVSRIDFMWLDMQGYELNVLKAAPNILATTSAIYTEVEFIEAYEKQYLYADVKAWLEQEGFTMIARDFNDNPTWFFGNALFVRNNLLSKP